MSWNSNEDFYRDFNDLVDGQQGIATGGSHNGLGLNTYEANRRAEQSLSQPGREPGQRERGPRANIDFRSAVSNLFWLSFLFMVAVLVLAFTGSWWAVGGAYAVIAGLAYGLVKFFKTPAGEKAATVIAWLVLGAVLVGWGWMIYGEFGSKGVMWMTIIVGTPVVLSLATIAIKRFFLNTSTGQRLLVWIRRLLIGSLVAATGYVGVVFWIQ